MSSLTAFAILSALLLVLSCSYMVDTKPVRGRRHSAVKTTSHTVHREKRATVADILGDLTAASPGILNEDRKCVDYSASSRHKVWRTCACTCVAVYFTSKYIQYI